MPPKSRPPAASRRHPRVAGRSRHDGATQTVAPGVPTRPAAAARPSTKPALAAAPPPASPNSTPPVSGREKTPLPSSSATAAGRAGPAPSPPAVLTIVLLMLVGVVFAGAAVVFRGQAARASTGAVDNRALVDSAATAEAAAQVSKAIETVLSYDYTRLEDTERASAAVITGKYRDEFARTFADVRRTAPEQKLALTTTVLLAGVTLLDGDRAELIATMDLAAVRDTTPYNSPGRVRVVAHREGGRWKVAEMTLL